MSKYYYLIAGLPNIALDDNKLTYSIVDFRTEIEPMLSCRDNHLVDLFFLKYDNKNLVEHARHPDKDPDPRGRITYEEFTALFKALKDEEKPPKNKHIPAYFEEFFVIYIAAQSKDVKPEISWEDQLASLYYEYAMH